MSNVGAPLRLLALVLLASCSSTTSQPPVAPSGAVESARPADHEPELDQTPRLFSDDPVVNQVVSAARTDNRVQDHLKVLTHTFGARLTGSHALMLAERWCRDQFTSFGLEAHLEHWGEFAVGFDRGPSSAHIVGDPSELVFTTMAWSPGVFGPVRGSAVLYPSSVAEAARSAEMWRGAWLVHREPRRRRPEDSADSRATQRIDTVLAKAEIAGHIWPAGDPQGQLVHTSGDPRIQWDQLSSEVNVFLRGDQHQQLVARLDANTPTELEFSIDNRFFRGPIPLHNVIADLPGTTWPDEYVIVGGHLDSWDGAQGAVDNGTGVATTMEAARLLAAVGAQPKRTIRFMLWSGEEQGLLGSEAYVAQHPEMMPKISAVLVHDGGTNYLSGLQVTPEMMADMQRVFEPVMRLNAEYPFSLSRAESLMPFGSDHTPFINAGVPAFFWDQAGRSDYDRMHHTQFDTFETAIPEYQQHSAVVVALAAWNLANLDHLLDRTNSAPIPPRRLGVELDQTVVTSILKDSMAAKAKWKKADRIVSIDGQAVDSTRAVVQALRQGGPQKTVVLERKGKTVTSVLDYRDDPNEQERERRRQDRAQRFGVPESAPAR